MLEDFRLKVFITVAQYRSFTKAAAELGVSQPAVSQNVAELEKLLGLKLFERLKGETVLTGEGEVFRTYAGRMLNTCSDIDDMFARLAPATVRISASEELYNFLVAPALESFRRLHPDIIFERTLFDDADLVISLKPSDNSPYDIAEDSVLRIRMSIYPTPKMGDFSATHEKTSYFDVLYLPSQAFSCTRLCRLIREFLIS